MIVKKILLVASAATLMSTPAWALPGHAPSNHPTKHAPSTTPVGPPSTTPNNTDNPGAANRSPNANHAIENGGANNKDNHGKDHPSNPNKPSHPSHPGQSHRCKAHNVAYVASGTLVSQTLVKNIDGTYSGGVTVNATHTNRHAAGDQGMTKTYTLTDVLVRFGLADINHDGSVNLDDLTAGDRVKAIGKITTLSKKCDQAGFTATTTIGRLVFHKPAK